MILFFSNTVKTVFFSKNSNTMLYTGGRMHLDIPQLWDIHLTWYTVSLHFYYIWHSLTNTRRT